MIIERQYELNILSWLVFQLIKGIFFEYLFLEICKQQNSPLLTTL